MLAEERSTVIAAVGFGCWRTELMHSAVAERGTQVLFLRRTPLPLNSHLWHRAALAPAGHTVVLHNRREVPSYQLPPML